MISDTTDRSQSAVEWRIIGAETVSVKLCRMSQYVRTERERKVTESGQLEVSRQALALGL